MTSSPFGDMPLQTFLDDYWQKKPLLIRQAFPDFVPPLAADELAGLACEDDIEARLIIQDADTDKWELQHGPFNDDVFAALPASHWTLLVQAVDHWAPAAADLINCFNFIPSWRLDDLMISYASKGGGVGPHYDNYDVFLIQASGQRRWEIGGLYDQNSPQRVDTPVMILPEWEPEEQWILNPGDMLYLPPQTGHNGIATSDDCMTCSVGFRAPSHSEILQHFTDYISDRLISENRYRDTALHATNITGEIEPEVIAKLQMILCELTQDEQLLSTWFGAYMTASRYADQVSSLTDGITIEELSLYLDNGGELIRNEGARFAFMYQNTDCLLFADGNHFECDSELAELLCKNRSISFTAGSLSNSRLLLLRKLVNQMSLYLVEKE